MAQTVSIEPICELFTPPTQVLNIFPRLYKR